MKSQALSTFNLPDSPGVYFFLGPKRPASTRGASSTRDGEILYVGKATSLKDRVRSYFAKDLIDTRGERLVEMVELAKSIKFQATDSVLEALILEANEIHKLQPPYNTLGKDDKTFNYVVFTKEDFPRLLVLRERELQTSDQEFKSVFGPFPHAGELREALKIIRRIFPYRDAKCEPTGKACWNYQIGLCPGTCIGKISKRDYALEVRRITLFFEGKKEKLLKSIERDMLRSAKEERFEEAARLRGMLYALEHIQDVALIKRDIERPHDANAVRIEAYDIAHLAGKQTVGVMTVVEDGELAKSQYRKFRIRSLKGNNDVGNLTEVLHRRLNHPEWPMPHIMVIDGGVGQLNAAKEVLKERGLEMDVVSVVKDKSHKAREILGDSKAKKKWEKSIILANAEAHRFAIGYHRKLRTKGFRI